MWGVSLTHPVLAFFLLFSFFFFFFLSVASFSFKSHLGFIHLWGVSLTHPMLTLVLCGEFLLHIPCCFQFYAGIFSHTSRASFIFMQGVSLILSVTAFVFFSCFSRFFPFLTHPMLAFLYCGEFLLHIPCWLHFYLGSFS